MPCRDCKDRKVGCHTECQKYIEFDRLNKLRLEKKVREQSIKRYILTKHRERWILR